MPKRNPLNLNPLQLKTLALMQHMARHMPAHEEGVEIGGFPHPHGDHFHLGDAVVMTRDASGLANPSVWLALERKGLIRSNFPETAVVTPAGLAYDTGVASAILHGTDH